MIKTHVYLTCILCMFIKQEQQQQTKATKQLRKKETHTYSYIMNYELHLVNAHIPGDIIYGHFETEVTKK